MYDCTDHEPQQPDISPSSRHDSSPVIVLEETTDERYLRKKDSLDDVFVVDLEKCDEGLGLGLIDGMVSETEYYTPGVVGMGVLRFDLDWGLS